MRGHRINYEKIVPYDYLYEHFIIKNERIQDIASSLNINRSGLGKYIKKLGLTRKVTKKMPDKTKEIEALGYKVLSKYRNNNEHITVKCKYCDNNFVVMPQKLFSGHTRSCGCLRYINQHNFHGFNEISGVYYSTLRSAAKVRNIEFKISIEDIWDIFLLQNRKCAITGLDIIFSPATKKTTTASVDRIDNSKPYSKDNIHIVHKYINRMKMNHSLDYFLYMCNLVTKNNDYVFSNDKFFEWEMKNTMH